MLYNQLKRVKAFIFAMEGVLTDSRILVGDSGGRSNRVDSRDYYVLRLAVACNYPVIFIGERHEVAITRFLEEIGINDVFLNRYDKRTILHDWMAGKGLVAEQVLCMGSDLPDLRAMELAGFNACPIDAAENVKAVAAYISPYNGGAGALRDVIEKVMRLQGTWSELRE